MKNHLRKIGVLEIGCLIAIVAATLTIFTGCGKKKTEQAITGDGGSGGSITQGNGAVMDFNNTLAVYSVKSSGSVSSAYTCKNCSVNALAVGSTLKAVLKSGEVTDLNFNGQVEELLSSKAGMVLKVKDTSQVNQWKTVIVNKNGTINEFKNSYPKYLTENGLLLYYSQDLNTHFSYQIDTGKNIDLKLNGHTDFNDPYYEFIMANDRDDNRSMLLDLKTGFRTNDIVNFSFRLNGKELLFCGYDLARPANVTYMDELTIRALTKDEENICNIFKASGGSAGGVYARAFTSDNSAYMTMDRKLFKIDSNKKIISIDEVFLKFNNNYEFKFNNAFSFDGNIAVLREYQAIAIVDFNSQKVTRILKGFNIKTVDVYNNKILFVAEDNYGNTTSGIYQLDNYNVPSINVSDKNIDKFVFIKN